MKVVYSITERGGKNYWTRIGAAFVNSDGSLNVKLECLPINGEMHIRDYVPRPGDSFCTPVKVPTGGEPL